MLQEYWPLFLIGFVALGVIYLTLQNMARTYAETVKRELEEYNKPQQAASANPMPIPARNLSDTPTVAEEKQRLWQAIQQHPLAPYQQVELLVHQLSIARIDAQFIENYFLMFGTQHLFLDELNRQTGTSTVTRVAAQAFLQRLGENNDTVRRHGFNNWLGYLAAQGFVSVGVDSISLTHRGQDFLIWITRRQLPLRTHEGV